MEVDVKNEDNIDTLSEEELLERAQRFENQKILTYLSRDVTDVMYFCFVVILIMLVALGTAQFLSYSVLSFVLVCFVLSAVIIVPINKRLWRFRRERHASRIALTKARTKTTLDNLAARGLKTFFFLDGLRDSEHQCHSCTEQVVSIAVRQRFQPVSGARVTYRDVHIGSYCPGCGLARAGETNKIQGNLKDLIWHLEAGRGETYALRPPASDEDIQVRLKVLETNIKQKELELAQDIAERDKLKESQALKEVLNTPAGYRVAISEVEEDAEDREFAHLQRRAASK